MKAIVFATLVVGGFAALPPWLPQAGLGFLEGFMSDNQADVDQCIVGLLTPIGDIKDGISDIKTGIKDRNLTDIVEGVQSFCTMYLKDFPAAMQQCGAAKADLKAIIEVVKTFHSIQDIISHIKSDLDVDSQGRIAAEFELMVVSFEEKKYDDFGNHLGKMLHHLVIGPEGDLRSSLRACSGSADPTGTFPMCYEGSAGALGVKEDVKVKLVTYASGKGTMDLTGSGIEAISCQGKSFTKTGQDISPDISDCLPKVISVKKVEYCSDSDTVYVTVKDSKIPLPVSATLKKVTCASADVVV